MSNFIPIHPLFTKQIVQIILISQNATTTPCVLVMFNNICSISYMKASLLLVKLGSLNHADVWNLTGGGLLAPWSARTIMSSVLFNVGPTPHPLHHVHLLSSSHPSCDEKRPSLNCLLLCIIMNTNIKYWGRLGMRLWFSRFCLIKSLSVFPLLPFRLVVLSFPSCLLVELLSLSWSSCLWWLNQEVCWEYTYERWEMNTNTKWYSTHNVAKWMN